MRQFRLDFGNIRGCILGCWAEMEGVWAHFNLSLILNRRMEMWIIRTATIAVRSLIMVHQNACNFWGEICPSFWIMTILSKQLVMLTNSPFCRSLTSKLSITKRIFSAARQP